MNKQLEEDGYLVIPNFINDTLRKFISHCVMLSINAGYGDTKDPQAPFSTSFYSHVAAETLLGGCTQYVSSLVEEEVLPTYSYTRLYRPGDELVMHTDRESCEISVSLCLDIPKDSDPMPLYFSKTTNKSEGKAAILNPGDACIYRGCDMWHWRDKFVEHPWYLQTFLHYVRKNGPYSDFVLDRRESLGMPPPATT